MALYQFYFCISVFVFLYFCISVFLYFCISIPHLSLFMSLISIVSPVQRAGWGSTMTDLRSSLAISWSEIYTEIQIYT